MKQNHPVYVLFSYMNRSGSTMVGQQLSRSVKVCVCPEADILVRMFLEDPDSAFCGGERRSELKKYRESDYKLAQWICGLKGFDRLEPGGVETNLDAFMYILRAYRDEVKPDADYVIFKDERLIFLTEKIIRAGKGKYDIRCFSILRDVRGIYESQKRTPMLPATHYMSRNPVRTALDWNRFVERSMELEGSVNLFLVQYESFVKWFPASMYLLASGLGINMEDKLKETGDLEERMLPGMRAIHQDMGKPPDRAKTDAWQKGLSQRDIYILQYLSGKWLRRLGYNTITGGPGYLSVMPLIAVWYVARVLRVILKKFAFHSAKIIYRTGNPL